MKTSRRILLAIAIIAATTASDMVAVSDGFTGNVCAAATYDTNSDGYIYKGTIYLTRVGSGRQDQFYLFNKRGVNYVATSKKGPYYRLARRMTINNIDYMY